MGVSLSWLLALAALPDATPVPLASRQLVLVVTPNETAINGVLRRFLRDEAGGAWEEVDSSWPIVVGKSGLASGAGLHQSSVQGLPVKKEGDGKSPAGVFTLRSAFGFGEAEAGLRIPYVRLSDSHECVDDPGSTQYNRIVDRRRAPSPDWKSSEKMREIDEYVYGVVVDHNADPPEPGAGSCIFLHAWSAAENPTVGCTAMPVERVRELVGWLDPEAGPVLVQLTQDAYRTLREPWKLPR
jgi:D-alanyl-D-alanine dipeptidase